MTELPKDDAFGVLGLYLFVLRVMTGKKRNNHEKLVFMKMLLLRKYITDVQLVELNNRATAGKMSRTTYPNISQQSAVFPKGLFTQ
jgi:hypothetical protein